MNKIYVNIINSNLPKLVRKYNYEVNLLKCIGSGSYGYIFLTDIDNYAVKILTEYGDKNNKEAYSDYNEIDVVNRIIDKKIKMDINNDRYGYGKLMNKYNFDDLTKKKIENSETKKNPGIYIHINLKDDLKIEYSVIKKREKVKTFLVYDNNEVIFMPIYLPFMDYIESFNNEIMFRNEGVLCLFVKKLLKSVDELLKINMINIDLKMSNVMINKKLEMKIIDFGMVMNKDKYNDLMDLNVNYYIWPHKKNYTYSMMIPYMIVIFILEIVFKTDVYRLQNNNFALQSLLEDLGYILFLSKEFKEIICNVLTDCMQLDEFRTKMDTIFSKYNLEELEMQNIYYYTMMNKGIKLFN